MDERIDLPPDQEAMLRTSANETWDTIVIGGGPSGAMAARQCALTGLKTLLVEAKAFPREKVCGGVLNHRAIRLLQHLQLDRLAAGQGTPVNEIDLIVGRQRSRFPLPAGRVVGRPGFDAALVETAAAAGAHILFGAQAVVEPVIEKELRTVSIAHNAERVQCRTRVVVCADGLSRSSMRHLPEMATTAAKDSLVGVGTVLNDGTNQFAIGRITMVVSRCGYVGIAHAGQSQLNIAAAVAPQYFSQRTPADLVASMLSDAGVDAPTGLHDAIWRGTPPLTRRPGRVVSERIFVVGDAGGYVEPFTGEGMATALEAGISVATFANRAAIAWAPSLATCWSSLHRQIVVERQSTCRRLAWILRRPWAASAALATCRTLPAVARYLIARTVRPTRATPLASSIAS